MYLCSMESETLYFNCENGWFKFNRTIPIPLPIMAWLTATANLYECEAFQFIRFCYEDYKVEVRHMPDRYHYKLVWSFKR